MSANAMANLAKVEYYLLQKRRAVFLQRFKSTNREVASRQFTRSQKCDEAWATRISVNIQSDSILAPEKIDSYCTTAASVHPGGEAGDLTIRTVVVLQPSQRAGGVLMVEIEWHLSYVI